MATHRDKQEGRYADGLANEQLDLERTATEVVKRMTGMWVAVVEHDVESSPQTDVTMWGPFPTLPECIAFMDGMYDDTDNAYTYAALVNAPSDYDADHRAALAETKPPVSS